MARTMRAIPLRAFGDAESMRVEDLPIPEPGVGEVRVRVTAAGVCGRDVLYRRGTLGAASGRIMGHEICGIVEALGPGTTRLDVGVRVAGTQRRSCRVCNYCTSGREVLCARGQLYGDELDGAYAEYCIVDELSLAQVPEGVSDAEAAIAACGIGTGLHALRLAGLRGGDRVLITGASGGVGMHAMQLASAMGAEVIAVTSSDRKVEALRANADRVLVMQDGAFHDSVRAESLEPDIVLDLTARYTLESSLRSVRRGGTVMIVGNMAPGGVEISPGAFIMRETTLIGSKACSRRELEDVLAMLSRGLVRSVIDRIEDLNAAPVVHRALEAKEIEGRAVLVP